MGLIHSTISASKVIWINLPDSIRSTVISSRIQSQFVCQRCDGFVKCFHQWRTHLFFSCSFPVSYSDADAIGALCSICFYHIHNHNRSFCFINVYLSHGFHIIYYSPLLMFGSLWLMYVRHYNFVSGFVSSLDWLKQKENERIELCTKASVSSGW